MKFTRDRYQQGALTIKQRQKGEKVWEFRYYDDDSAGNRSRRTVTAGTLTEYPTETAARKAPLVQGILSRINSGTISAEPVTFGAALARYEAEEMPERYSTQASYKSYIGQHIRPRWAETQLSAIKPLVVENWLKGLTLAPSTKNHIKGVMHSIFECCQRWELLNTNPIALVRVKDASKRLKQPRNLTPEEFQTIAYSVPEPFRTMVFIAGGLGLRVSEIVGLQWQDFDFEAGTLLIQRSIVHGRVGETKTEYSKDRVPLDTSLIETMRKHEAVACKTPNGWVFANPSTGKPYHQEEIQKRYIRKAATAAGITEPIGWHTFRHSFRTWLGQVGAPLSVQQALMRHASITTTMNTYGKTPDAAKMVAHSAVMDLLKPNSQAVQG